ncbi:sodium-dependent transporter [Synergistes jonesii]|uniref:Transporter n=1 Tax=Synergistes jonesii TaxID=2754 RepID=A0A073IST5_9BACT|nr:sodium-dependent transporter [Synergistes jonesii]KEJ92874.1 sodium transporter [Synergistes jonesii]OFB64160.1 sodium transporter [Synergistes jonesii]OFB64663.1 sodium transporter [Synergistes jonesii]OFB68422.1 sodium transporter [Synergistes jonesii]OFB75084.1 sodium transporter [Synergistes jonesii]
MSSNLKSAGNAFSGVYGFLMTAIGCALGIGTIWRFPYSLGANGGAIYLIAYVAIIAAIGVPLLAAETAIGFKSQKTAVLAYRELSPDRKIWSIAGYLHFAAALMIISYTLPIYAWILGYLYNTVAGTFAGLNANGLSSFFEQFSADKPLIISLMMLNIAINMLVLRGGVKKGVELLTKALLPVLGVIMVVLIIAGLRMEGAFEGVKYLFKPDYSLFNISSLKNALGQAFYAIGLAILANMVFGSYLKNPDENIGKTSAVICISLVTAGVMAGLMIFPALFASGLKAQSGVALVFMTVPLIFDTMPLGRLMGTLFFLGFYIAALTSSTGVAEAVIGMIMEQFHMNRKKTLPFLIAIMTIIGYFALPAGDFFNICDIITSNYLIILGALAIAIFTGWIWGVDNFVEAINVKNHFVKLWMKISVKYIAPVVIVIIFVTSIFL